MGASEVTMGDETEIRSARRGLLLSVLLILVAGVAVTYSAFRYLPKLQMDEPGRVAQPVDEAQQKLYAAEDGAPAVEFQDRYPKDTTPPAGARYPCPFTPLPPDMTGIPPSHRGYVNHVCGLLVRAIHVRLEACDGGWPPKPPEGLLDRYLYVTKDIVAKLKKEPVPPSMAEAHKQLLECLELQMTFFQRGYEARGSGQSWEQIVKAIPEEQKAHLGLMGVWSAWQARYSGMSPAVSDSVCHHFCALDLE